MKRSLLISAALLAVTGLAHAQGQVQVQIQKGQVFIQPAYPVQPGTKPVENTEFKPTAGSTADPKSLDVNEADSLKARELVRQFNSPLYKERESATRDIAKMGRFAVPALKDALATESSPEVRLRIDLVMPKAEAEDMQARVSCFLNDAEGKFDHQLPGWTKFKTLLGNDKSTRELFAEVLRNKTYHSLMLACDLPSNELGAVLIGHYQGIQNRQNFPQTGRGQNLLPTTAEIAVLAFLESMYSDRELTLTNQWNYISVASYMYNVDIQAAMIPNRSPGKYGVVLKKIVTRWLDTRESPNGLQQAMQFAQQWQMTAEVPKYAAKILVGESPQGQWYIKFNAMQQLGQHKDAKKYLPQITKVFEDTSIVQQAFPGQGANQATIQLGDFALGLFIKIAGQNPKDYGLEVMNVQDHAKFQQNNYYFKDEKDNKAEDKRKAAIKKFNEWIVKQPKEEEPKKDEPKKDEPKKDEPKKDQPQPQPLPTPIPKK